ncbi:MAG: translation initiation factor IF-3 [Actinomycetota bacterium]|nr:translation initiation factor IF-3 [Actinomycetota bacterium]
MGAAPHALPLLDGGRCRWGTDIAVSGRYRITTREPRVNERIRAREVRLVDPDGGQIGLKTIEEARWLADQLGLDLVEVAPDAKPPVVRMMDYGKFKYEQSVRAREARKKQTRTVIKEVQFRPKISLNDFEVKRKRVERFLGEGDKVKVSMRFRGREVTHPELGREVLDRLAAAIEGSGTVETAPMMDNRQMTMVLAPLRRTAPAAPVEPAAAVAAGDGQVPTEVAAGDGLVEATSDGTRSDAPAAKPVDEDET